MGFTTPEDIANRALQHCGARRIQSLEDNSKNASEIAQCYDGLREAELQRNVWRFAVRRAILYPIVGFVSGLTVDGDPATQGYPSLLLVPETWSATKTYRPGYIVSYNDEVWVNTASVNVGQQPGVDGSTGWDIYFGSMCVQPYDTTGSTAYFLGDLIYRYNAGAIGVYVSLQNGNSADPLDPGVWASGDVYNAGDIVQDAQGYYWQSQVSNNTTQPGVYGQWSSAVTYETGDLVIGTDYVLYEALQSSTDENPAFNAAPTYWESAGTPGSWPQWNTNTTYAEGAIVEGDGNYIYLSLQSGNTGQQPVGSVINPNDPSANWWQKTTMTASWNSNFVGSTANPQWLGLAATTDSINITYPVGVTPSINNENRHLYMLPNGYLRPAPQMPSAGATSFLGAPTGLMADDWELDDNYIVTTDAHPIQFRFVANITNVSKMSPMFCEGLAARIAEEVCEPLTQSNAKLAAIDAAYKRAMGDARIVAAIEQEPTSPEEDDYITCRW